MLQTVLWGICVQVSGLRPVPAAPAAVTAQTVFSLPVPWGPGGQPRGMIPGAVSGCCRAVVTHQVCQSQGPDPGPVTGAPRAAWPQRSAALLSVRRALGGRRTAHRRPLSPDAASLGGVVLVLGGRGEAWARAGVAADTGRLGSASALSSV